jgi:hypothetical protein
MKFLTSLVALSSIASVSMAATTPSKCDPDYVSPKPKLPKGAFDLEGFGKENPLGAVTGGKGGSTTTISASSPTGSAALVAALEV